jgi:hypothetical protein
LDAILVISALAIGIILLTFDVWAPEWWFPTPPTAATKPPVHRLRRVIGFVIVAIGVSITFLPVSADLSLFAEGVLVHVSCGSAWQAMFTNPHNYNEAGYGCGRAAFPYVSIAGGVVAVGLVVAFWGEGRGRLLRMAGVAVLVPGLIQILGLMGSGGMGGA